MLHRCAPPLTLMVGLLLSGPAATQTPPCTLDSLVPTGEGADFRCGNGVAIDGNLLAVGLPGAVAFQDRSGTVAVYAHDGADWVLDELVMRNEQWGDEFGYSVSLSGTLLAIGMPREVTGGQTLGKVWIYERDPTIGWQPRAGLVPANLLDDRRAGHDVDLEFDRVVIGAPGEGAAPTQTGLAWIVLRTGSQWNTEFRLDASGLSLGDRYGMGVAVEDDDAVVGAPGHDVGGADRGAVYVFGNQITSWDQEQKLFGQGTVAGDRFGSSVDLAGNRLVVGAPGATPSGAVFVFERAGPGQPWIQTARLDPTGASVGAAFGSSVSLVPEGVLIGGPADDTTGTDAGRAWLFAKTRSGWAQAETFDGAAPGQRAGSSVALHSGLVAVGAPGADLGPGSDSGLALTWGQARGTWSPLTPVTPPNGAEDEKFGWALDLDGSTAVVGQPEDDSAPIVDEPTGFTLDDGRDWGRVQVFDHGPGGWVHTDSLTAPVPDTNDRFGQAVAIHGDVLAVGAPWADPPPFTLDVLPGRVDLFERSAGSWTSIGSLRGDGTSSSLPLFADELALGDGRLFVGCPGQDHVSPAAGAVHLFESSGGPWTVSTVLGSVDATAGQGFGGALALDDLAGLLVVGAPSDDTSGTNTGVAYIFQDDAIAGWIQRARLDSPGPSTGARFGDSVAVDGGTVVVSAPQADGTADGSGIVVVFRSNGGSWSVEQVLMPADGEAGDRFGAQVRLEGDVLAVTATNADDGPLAHVGVTYVYRRAAGTWSLVARYVSDAAQVSDRMGQSLALDEGRILTGRHDAIGWPPPDLGRVEEIGCLPEASWSDQGGGTAGQAGVPSLTGEGVLLGDTPFLLRVTDAAPGAEAVLDVSGALPAVVGPWASVAIGPLSVDPSGHVTWAGSWPPGVPSGATTTFRIAVLDPTAADQIAWTNLLVATAP